MTYRPPLDPQKVFSFVQLNCALSILALQPYAEGQEQRFVACSACVGAFGRTHNVSRLLLNSVPLVEQATPQCASVAPYVGKCAAGRLLRVRSEGLLDVRVGSLVALTFPVH